MQLCFETGAVAGFGYTRFFFLRGVYFIVSSLTSVFHWPCFWGGEKVTHLYMCKTFQELSHHLRFIFLLYKNEIGIGFKTILKNIVKIPNYLFYYYFQMIYFIIYFIIMIYFILLLLKLFSDDIYYLKCLIVSLN